ncbi:lysophosphatidic acid receptor 6-like isoform X1 [Coregonus clupeaformis]|uniref:lysophosphatidic acid receptor 6-like isoform X1 n=2 Tax=Coregonus clupeaformis TaxID=59861 RepID=UPI001E1C5DA8|nr:lysophosphatidic acid receptor 6-like isoform X1 [Coregonus clupeaformis]
MTINTTHNCTEPQSNLIFVGVYAIVFTVGLFLNVTALVVFFCYTKLRSHTTVYMTNLAIADLLLVLTLPLRIYYHLGLSRLPQILCEGMGLVLLANMYGSIFLLTCMCFDRCMAVCLPMSSWVQEGRKKAPLVCLGVWLLTAGASLPIYISKRREASNDIQEVNCFGNLPVYAIQPMAVASTLTVGFGIPLVVMLVCSWALIRAITRSSIAQTDLIDSGKIQRMITISLVIFLTCFLPYHGTLALLYVHREAITCPLLAAYHYSLMVACLNAMLDPLAYYFTTETFRRKVDKDSDRKMFPLNSQNSSEGNNRGSRGPVNT